MIKSQIVTWEGKPFQNADTEVVSLLKSDQHTSCILYLLHTRDKTGPSSSNFTNCVCHAPQYEKTHYFSTKLKEKLKYEMNVKGFFLVALRWNRKQSELMSV